MRGRNFSRALALGAALILTTTSALAAPAPPAKKRISIDVYKADLHNVVRLFADVSGKNFVIPDDIQAEVTLKLTNVAWDDALAVVLKLEGLGMEERGNIIRIAPQAELDAERAARLAEQDAWQKTAPLVTRVIQVNYARASELAPLIKEVLSERGKVTYDSRTNVLIVRDVPGSPALRY